MSSRFHHADYEATVKCSFCNADIATSTAATHECSPSHLETQGQRLYGNLPFPVHHQPQYEPYGTDGPHYRDHRPALPKLDSSVNNRSGLRPGEAANIAHDLGLPSPTSAGSSGHKSPHRSRSRSRRPLIERSPSPDGPLAQDCAFPAFPMKPKRSQSSKESRKHNPHSTSRSTASIKTFQHSSSQSNASSVYSAGSGTVKRMMSNTSSTPRSRQGTVDESNSTLSSASGSPKHKISLPLRRQQSTEQTQSFAQYDGCLISEPSPSASTMPPTPSWPLDPGLPSPKIVQSPNSEIGWTPIEHAIPEEQIHELDDAQHMKSTRNMTEPFDRILPPESVRANANLLNNQPKEPLYKTKRPPALSQTSISLADDPLMPKSARVTSSTPSHGGLARSLTNLFTRKRTQSSTIRTMPSPSNDSLHARALAPDPPARPKRGENLWDDASSVAANSQDSGPSISPATRVDPHFGDASPVDKIGIPTKNIPSEQPEVESPDGRQDASDLNFTYGHIEQQRVMVEAPEMEHNQTVTPVMIAPASALIPSNEAATVADLRRASIDSASSYGSIGFSNRTASSRSTLPSSDETRRKPAPALETSHSHIVITEVIPPERQENTSLDSPTDPLYSGGRLLPVTDLISGHQFHPQPTEERVQQGQNAPVSEVCTDKSLQRTRAGTSSGVKGRCRGCSNLILTGQKSVSSADGRLTGKYHKKCFGCQTCKEAFSTADFYVFDDYPYCAHHYHVLNNTLCIGCEKGIEGEYLETSDVVGVGSKKFHAKCLQCATCKMQLLDDFFEFHGRVYCERDAFRAASGPNPRNPYDTVPSRPSPLIREYINSEDPGLKGRFPERRTTRLIMT